jgi:hypothetical protein
MWESNELVWKNKNGETVIVCPKCGNWRFIATITCQSKQQCHKGYPYEEKSWCGRCDYVWTSSRKYK